MQTRENISDLIIYLKNNNKQNMAIQLSFHIEKRKETEIK